MSSLWRRVERRNPECRENRRLDTQTYDTKCKTCIWGCRMPVKMIIDQCSPSKKQYRSETYYYGPKSGPFDRPGPFDKRRPGKAVKTNSGPHSPYHCLLQMF